MVTGDNAYIEYNNQAYEVGSKEYAQLRDQIKALEEGR